MNRSGIEWCDHTWNPITGCFHGCHYCYARIMTTRFSGNVRLNKMAVDNYSVIEQGDRKLYVLDEPMKNETGHDLVYPFGFEPTFHRYRLNTLDKMKMGNNIFVGAMADVFGEWVPDSWIDEIMRACEEHPIHNFLFLTKNPDRYVSLLLKDKLPELPNMWYGVTVTNSPQAMTAEAAMQDLPNNAHSFLSIEPIMEDVIDALKITIANFTDWVIIGAETGRKKDKVIPKIEWINHIVSCADAYGVPVFMKDSLIPIVGEKSMRREFPEQLQHKRISQKMQEKLYDICCSCGEKNKKREMITILARSKRGEQPKQFCFICRKCFEGFCKENGIEMPDLMYRKEINNGK